MTKFFATMTIVLGLALPGLTVSAPKLGNSQHSRYIITTETKDIKSLSSLSHWLERNDFDVAGINLRNGTIEVITDEAGMNSLRSKGLHGDLFERVMGFVPAGPDPRYLNPSTVEKKLKALHASYPQLTRLEQIGSSLQGRAIWALLISETPAINDPMSLQKPSIIFDGLHHAREIMTPEVVMDVAETVLKKVQTDKNMQNLVHTWQIWLVPMLNVDGSNIVFTSDNMWRKNAHSDQNNIFGVDINRNYDFKWASCNGSSISKNAADYHGTSAASEPETKALQDLADRVRPTASLSYHTYSEFVLFPYGCGGLFSPENIMIQKIANELAAKLPADSGGGTYTPGTPWQLLYDVDGSSMDYMYGTYGTLSYTFEMNQDFQPDYSFRDPTVAKHRDAWTYFLNRIDQNLLTLTTIDGKSGMPAKATISIDTIKYSQGEHTLVSNTAGKFFKVLDPGHYLITAKFADGGSATVVVDMNGTAQQKSITIE